MLSLLTIQRPRLRGARRADPGPGTRFPALLKGTRGMADAQPKRVQALPIVSISGSRGLMVLTDSSYLPQIRFFRVTLDHSTPLNPQSCAAALRVSPSSLASGLRWLVPRPIFTVLLCLSSPILLDFRFNTVTY